MKNDNATYEVLARKWRPQTFADVVGQEHITRTLQNAISQERVLCIILDEFQFVDDGTLNVILSLLKRSSGRIVLCGALQLLQRGKAMATEGAGMKKFLTDARRTERIVEIMLAPFGIKAVP